MDNHDVIVVGGGPAGSAAALWLARAGWDVAIVEKKIFPRAKTCGDGLTPRAVRQLQDMGLEHLLQEHHLYTGLRAVGMGRTLELQWPAHGSFPSYGYVITRADLDLLVANAARQAGAVLHEGEAASPWIDSDGTLKGVSLGGSNGDEGRKIAAQYIVVADGSNSRFGRSLGAQRNKEYPLGMAIRSYWPSPRSTDPWIESHMDLRDDSGSVVPGYGWIFPLGDGRLNVGVGLLSSSARWKGLNTTKLLETFISKVCERWQFDPADRLQAPTGGKLPMGLSVRPLNGANWLLAGDAAGSINPFNGEGIAYGYETGRLAAWAVSHALSKSNSVSHGGVGSLEPYTQRLELLYSDYYRLAKAFVALIGHPEVMRALLATGMRSPTMMGWTVRLMANLMRPDEVGPAEIAYKALVTAAERIPFSLSRLVS